ncbi:MAG: hypothetical protein ACKO85_02435 [Isosphaeraceae bacterium]
MTDESLETILDDLFLGCALAAFVEMAKACQGYPESEPTRRLAYAYYEKALAGKNAKKP